MQYDIAMRTTRTLAGGRRCERTPGDGMNNSSGDADALIHILYIDDDEGLALLMQKNLRRRGFSVEWAESGAAGLARLGEGGIDAVVLDHVLAGETGLDILPCITALPDHPPVIYATGSDDTSIAVAALKAGADDYMFKGISADYFDLLAAALEQ